MFKFIWYRLRLLGWQLQRRFLRMTDLYRYHVLHRVLHRKPIHNKRTCSHQHPPRRG